MNVTIHQPEHLPWLGLIDKIHQSDLFVILDHVQYRKRGFQNRNKIRVAEGEGYQWLTVPVQVKGKYEQPINEVLIDNEGNPRWREKSWKALEQAYRKAPFWSEYCSFFETLYQKEWQSLSSLNVEIIRFLIKAFDIKVEIIFSSELKLETHKADLILDICKNVQAKTYISGIVGKEYLNVDQFAKFDIGLSFQEFYHPIYKQLHEPFIPGMSCIDLLFNHGGQSKEIMWGVKKQTVDFLFH